MRKHQTRTLRRFLNLSSSTSYGSYSRIYSILGGFVSFGALATSTSASAGEPTETTKEDVEQIVVTGARTEQQLSDTPVATEVIGRPEIEIMGAENLADLLEEYPSIDLFQSLGRTAIRLQGLDPEYILILVNGQRTTGRINGTIDLTRFAADDIERVEIVRGPSSALYGSDAIGGVVNIITRKPQQAYEASARGAYGSQNILDIHGNIGLSGETWSANFTAGHHRGDGYDLTPETIDTTAGAFHTVNVATQLNRDLAEALSLFGYTEYRFSDVDAIESANGGRAIIDRRNRIESFQSTLGSNIKLNENSKLTVNLNYTQYRDQFVEDQRNASGPGSLDDREETIDQTLQLTTQYNAKVFKSHEFTAGLEGLYEFLETDRISATGDRQRGAIYLQDQWTLHEDTKLILVPGFRLDLDSQFGAAPTPKVAIRFDPYKQLTIRASYGWGFRAPSFRELLLEFENPAVGYVVRGNPDLQPEVSRSLNINFEYEPFSGFVTTVNLFRNDIDNLINFGLVSDGNSLEQEFVYQNISSAYTQGVEAAIRMQIMSGLGLDFGYTLTDTFDNDSRRELAGRARHRGTAAIRWRIRFIGLDGTIRSSLVGRRTFFSLSEDEPTFSSSEDEPSTEVRTSTAPYATIDIRISQTITLWDSKFSLFGALENLLEEGELPGNPLQPRTFTLGLRGQL